jgi:cohesin loading factor subunit SCC2
MDAIFASPEEEGRGRLLKILQDFLVAESAKHSAKEKGVRLQSFLKQSRRLISSLGNVKGKNQNTSVNMEELVGNTDDFADSG